ncbi:MAG: protease SohB [Gammaproteobacteria bacterium]|nr:protease SohB [Gammaproteobacteria bacterium]MXX95338.1 protease SohB [Gammaproteobacteria bacterium]MYF52753.1 protease SohB [Gammaproteobacteria bacterium]MYK42994.1 protease SohB [Gammaproteobacteria bacterium]
MTFVFEYFMFLLCVATIVIAIIIVVGFIGSMVARRTTHRDSEGQLEVKHLNDFYDHLKGAVSGASLMPKDAKKVVKEKKKEREKRSKQQIVEAKVASKSSEEQEPKAPTVLEDDSKSMEGDLDSPAEEVKEEQQERKKNVFVIGFKGDLQATRVNNLRYEVSAILTHARKNDEVVVRVKSPGGVVHSYGHVASQLLRVKKAGIKLTVAIDEVAASGGYMVAVVADQIIAAPFALVGSIGVVAEIPNFNRLLKKYDVDYEVLTAGKYKRTLSIFGENTDTAREKFLQEIEDIHLQFQEFVKEHREIVDLDIVATGESWYGERAKAINLIDDIQTSDEYIMQACEEADVFELKWRLPKKQWNDLLNEGLESMMAVINWVRGRIR